MARSTCPRDRPAAPKMPSMPPLPMASTISTEPMPLAIAPDMQARRVLCSERNDGSPRCSSGQAGTKAFRRSSCRRGELGRPTRLQRGNSITIEHQERLAHFAERPVELFFECQRRWQKPRSNSTFLVQTDGQRPCQTEDARHSRESLKDPAGIPASSLAGQRLAITMPGHVSST